MLFPHRSISQGRATNLEAASLILRRLDAMRLAGVSSQTHDLLDTRRACVWTRTSRAAQPTPSILLYHPRCMSTLLRDVFSRRSFSFGKRPPSCPVCYWRDAQPIHHRKQTKESSPFLSCSDLFIVSRG